MMPSTTADPATTRSSPATLRSGDIGSAPAADSGWLRVAVMAISSKQRKDLRPEPHRVPRRCPGAEADVLRPQATEHPRTQARAEAPSTKVPCDRFADGPAEAEAGGGK